MDGSSSPFACLPWELVRRIVDIAAATSRHSARHLCLTAEWTQQIARPHLLHTVVIKTNDSLHSLASLIADSLPLGPSRASNVRNAWLSPSISQGDTIMNSILHACDNLEHIAVPAQSYLNLVVTTTAFRPEAQPVPFSNDLHLTLLDRAQHPAWFAGFLVFHWTKSPLLSHTTHLRLVETGPYHECMPLHYYPRLSHFAVPYCGAATHDLSELQKFLCRQSLRMLVIEVVPGCVSPVDRAALEDWVRRVRKTDARVFIVERLSDDLQRDWENEMRGGESIWSRAVRYTSALGVGTPNCTSLKGDPLCIPTVHLHIANTTCLFVGSALPAQEGPSEITTRSAAKLAVPTLQDGRGRSRGFSRSSGLPMSVFPNAH